MVDALTVVAYINAWIYKYECSPHKATVDELFEHFYQYKQQENYGKRTI